VHPWVTWLLFYFEKIHILCALKVFGLLTFRLLSESPLCQWQSYLREDVDVVRDLSSERDAVIRAGKQVGRNDFCLSVA
jgi:hypothetical protein